MARPIAKYLIAAVIFIVAVLAAALIGIFGRSAPELSPLPNPNGYDDFIAAGKMISGEVSNYRALSEPELRALVSKNADALKRVRTGLSRDCRVPLDYSVTNTAHLDDLSTLKRLSQLLVAEGQLAELEKQPADAAQSYLAAIRLGCELSRGGVLLDFLVGQAIGGLAAGPLEKLAPSLNASQCRELAAALETAEARQDSLELMEQQEKAWARRTFGAKAGIIRLVTYRQMRPALQKAETNYKNQQTRLRMLMLQLASRAYELEKGSRPTNSSDLVPTYLKTMPKDPLTGADMRLPQ